MFRRFSVLFFFLACASLYAQPDTAEEYHAHTSNSVQVEAAFVDTMPAAPQAVQYDSSAVVVRSAENTLQKFRDNPDFSYDRTVVLHPTLWDQFVAWLLWLLSHFFPDEESSWSVLWTIVFYALIGSALVYVVFRLTGTSFVGLFGRAGKRAVTTELFDENIHEIDFDKLISEAEQQQLYRKALRLLYLRSLKELSDGNYIHWSIDRTNREYLAELPAGELRKSFEQLTLLFEYIWYGDFPVDRVLFEHSRDLFRNFSTMTAQHV